MESKNSSLSEPEGNQGQGGAGRVPRPEKRMKKLPPGSVPGVGPCRESLAFECLGSAADHWSSGTSQAPGSRLLIRVRKSRRWAPGH